MCIRDSPSRSRDGTCGRLGCRAGAWPNSAGTSTSPLDQPRMYGDECAKQLQAVSTITSEV
eukprot:5028675-Alexandrium_andersonii.AAC.1